MFHTHLSLSEIDALIAAAYCREDYPVLIHQKEQWQQSLPLKGIRILDATPVFRNTLTKHRALIAAGATLIVGVSNMLPHDPKITALLSRSGIPVLRPEDTPLPTDIILDCAAEFRDWNPRIGFVELTRSGTDKFARIDKPVFVADNGKIKRIETCLGTGESFFRAMEQLGYRQWNDRRLVVFGSGKVGTGIIVQAQKKGTETIVVTDPATLSAQVIAACSAVIDYRNPTQVAAALATAYAVVTATGKAHALEGTCPTEALIESPALLANMGVEDEYGPSIPTQRVLMDKKALNFILEEPTHLKYIDATMALHNEGALYLLSHPTATGIIEPPAEIETRLLEICRQQGCIAEELALL